MRTQQPTLIGPSPIPTVAAAAGTAIALIQPIAHSAYTAQPEPGFHLALNRENRVAHDTEALLAVAVIVIGGRQVLWRVFKL